MREPTFEPIDQTNPSGRWIDRVEAREHTSRDGVRLFYEVVGRGPETLVLANGLGGRIASWEPFIEAMASRFRFVIWDYRGIFQSHASRDIQRLSIPEHADDIMEILDAEGIKTATFVGWSMGVQVSLEAAVRYPERVERLVLLNGTYGKVLQTGYQPIFRVPWMNKVLHEVLDFGISKPHLIKMLEKQLMGAEKPFRFAGSLWGKLYDNPKMADLLWLYMKDIFSTDFGNYLRLFQELDAHSVYHHLRDIHQPTLIVSGLMDLLTPAYQSKEMARKMPNARHISIPRGTHFVLVEYPAKIIALIGEFLRES